MKRLLFLKGGPYFMPTHKSIREKYKLLSANFSGDILAVVNKKEFRHFNIENFCLQGLYLPQRIRYLNMFRNILYATHAIAVSTYVHYFNNRYDAIIAYDPLLTGLLALIIGKITGMKIIVEVNGNYKAALELSSEKIKFSEGLKHKIANFIIPFVLKGANGIKLLYKEQLEPFSRINFLGHVACFHNFVAISQFSPTLVRSKYILFLGYPWFLKGVDVLIRAYNKVYYEFPEYTLKIVGYCSDKTYFEELVADNERIQLYDPVQHSDAIKLMEGCSLFVLPSRTEAMGRVLFEAMASKKPIICSNVDGIPTYVKDGYNGLLFESENIDDLAEKIKILLDDKKYRNQLAENGYRYVHENLSPESYIDKYNNFIEKVLTK